MSTCPFKNCDGRCVSPNGNDGPPCSFSGTDYTRECAVYPLHMSKQQGTPMSATEAIRMAYGRGLRQKRPG